MAEAFGNMYGMESIKPFSCGSQASGDINPNAIESMKEIGYDLSVHRSKGYNEIPDMEYDLAVSVGCGDECPTIKAKKRQDWNIPDPKHMVKNEFAEVRDLICEKVKDLIKNI